jgi:hypothetical protein
LALHGLVGTVIFSTCALKGVLNLSHLLICGDDKFATAARIMTLIGVNMRSILTKMQQSADKPMDNKWTGQKGVDTAINSFTRGCIMMEYFDSIKLFASYGATIYVGRKFVNFLLDKIVPKVTEKVGYMVGNLAESTLGPFHFVLKRICSLVFGPGFFAILAAVGAGFAFNRGIDLHMMASGTNFSKIMNKIKIEIHDNSLDEVEVLLTLSKKNQDKISNILLKQMIKPNEHETLVCDMLSFMKSNSSFTDRFNFKIPYDELKKSENCTDIHDCYQQNMQILSKHEDLQARFENIFTDEYLRAKDQNLKCMTPRSYLQKKGLLKTNTHANIASQATIAANVDKFKNNLKNNLKLKKERIPSPIPTPSIAEPAPVNKIRSVAKVNEFKNRPESPTSTRPVKKQLPYNLDVQRERNLFVEEVQGGPRSKTLKTENLRAEHAL